MVQVSYFRTLAHLGENILKLLLFCSFKTAVKRLITLRHERAVFDRSPIMSANDQIYDGAECTKLFLRETESNTNAVNETAVHWSWLIYHAVESSGSSEWHFLLTLIRPKRNFRYLKFSVNICFICNMNLPFSWGVRYAVECNMLHSNIFLGLP